VLENWIGLIMHTICTYRYIYMYTYVRIMWIYSFL
jgi:hypothetical protein